MNTVRIAALILLVLLSAKALGQNQISPTGSKRDSNIQALARPVEAFSIWKTRVEEVALDIKKRSPLLVPLDKERGGDSLTIKKGGFFRFSKEESSSTLLGVKWLYDDARASVNGLVDRIIFDLQNGTLPKGHDPYRNSILDAESKVNAFLSHARNVVIRQARETAPAENRNQLAVERDNATGQIVEVGWPAVVAAVSFLAAAIDLTSIVLKQFADLPKNPQTNDDFEIIISQLRSLQLRPFENI